MVALSAVSSVVSIVLIIAIGYILTKIGWFDQGTAKLFSRIVVNVALPPMMVVNIVSSFDRQSLQGSGKGLFIPFVSMVACYLISLLAAKLLRVRYERRGIFQAMFFASNTIFIGLPVNIALFGEQSVPYVLLYYISNTLLFWTIGIYSISKYISANKESLFSINALKKVFSPPLMGFIVGVALVFLDINLPAFVMDTSKYLGNLTTPLSLLFIGITFNAVSIKHIRFDKDMAGVFIGRFIVSPLILLAAAMPFQIPVLMTKVFVIQAAMPVIMQAAIITKAYGADYEYATIMVTTSTVASLIFIPIYMVLLSGI